MDSFRSIKHKGSINLPFVRKEFIPQFKVNKSNSRVLKKPVTECRNENRRKFVIRNIKSNCSIKTYLKKDLCASKNYIGTQYNKDKFIIKSNSERSFAIPLHIKSHINYPKQEPELNRTYKTNFGNKIKRRHTSICNIKKCKIFDFLKYKVPLTNVLV